MKKPVIAIGLESADPALVNRWMQTGHLKNLRRLRQRGAYGELTHIEHHANETEWTSFLTGCLPWKTGFWRPMQFDPSNYDYGPLIRNYGFQDYPPFYAVGPDYRVAVFDMPQTALSSEVNGIQVLAWGAHDPQTPRVSDPPELFEEIEVTYGKHPAFKKGFGDNWWDDKYLKFLTKSLKVGISRRAAICQDLLTRENWDLFLTVFGEPHSAGHNLWHLSQADNAVYQFPESGDPLQEVFQAIDQTIGEMLEVIPKDSYVLIFSGVGMGNNFNELPSRLFLPELLYRYSFPGQVAITDGDASVPVPPPLTNPRMRNWGTEVWRYKSDAYTGLRKRLPFKAHTLLSKLEGKLPGLSNHGQVVSPYDLLRQGENLWAAPALWYAHLWPQMVAFALPSFSDGFIRINLANRETQGIVALSDYERVCAEITAELYALRDARTGRPIVEKVVPTRTATTAWDPKLPDADLTVIWAEQPTDVIDSPTHGRIGPVPYQRSGGHRPGGFLFASGPGILPDSTLSTGQMIDLAPTILSLMGAPLPDYLQGKPLLTPELLVRAA
ncbi:MAG: alkaline phosphatase family protein [Leptolyngbya sp. SIO1E4]|nr:alkaline phosphatase family protein [Leptolyngbya sp. SIO1E4]